MAIDLIYFGRLKTTHSMKTHAQPTRRRGFTLVELLVVIAIIAVLAGLSFAGVNVALKKARTTEAKVAATTLALGVERFYDEYGRLPDLSQPEIETDSQEGILLLQILLAQEQNASNRENRRSISFVEFKEGKGRRGGLVYGTDNEVEGLYDPFGEPYTVVLNLDYEDELSFSLGGQQYDLRDREVVVYSPGADRELGTKDDVTTFERK